MIIVKFFIYDHTSFASINLNNHPLLPAADWLPEWGKLMDKEHRDKVGEFSNPHAPEGVPPPRFALPVRGRGGGEDLRRMMMTPRSVVASTRSYSSVVYAKHRHPSFSPSHTCRMTPRAGQEGEGGKTSATVHSLPLPLSRHVSHAQTVRGPKTSAKEQPIFSHEQEQPYKDRAWERRQDEREGTRLRTHLQPQSTRHPSHGGQEFTPVQQTERGMGLVGEMEIELDLQVVRDRKAELERKEREAKIHAALPSDSTSGVILRPLSYLSRLAESICVNMGWDPLRGRKDGNERDQERLDAFIPGRTLYIYDLKTCIYPRIITRSLIELSARGIHLTIDRDAEISVLEAVRTALHSERSLKDAASGTIQRPPPVPSINHDLEDIFPQAGEYVCAPKKQSETQGNSNLSLFSQDFPPLQAEASIPSSIAHLLERVDSKRLAAADLLQKTRFGKEEEMDTLAEEGHSTTAIGEYEECYPGVFEAPGIEYEDSDEEGEQRGGKRGPPEKGTPSSRKRLAAKEKQKLDKQVERVDKILEEKYGKRHK